MSEKGKQHKSNKWLFIVITFDVIIMSFLLSVWMSLSSMLVFQFMISMGLMWRWGVEKRKENDINY